MLTLIHTVPYIAYHKICSYVPHHAWAVNHAWLWTSPIRSGIPLLNPSEMRKSLWFIWLRSVQGILCHCVCVCVHVWSCTRALCIGNGHSLLSCLYRVSMEMCCTTLQQGDYREYLTLFFCCRGWKVTLPGVYTHTGMYKQHILRENSDLLQSWQNILLDS